MKCTIDGVAVDITSNQLGGLATSCFLTEVDQRIGHDHLFLDTLLLVKAWAHYDAKIVGAAQYTHRTPSAHIIMPLSSGLVSRK